jgi:hypothetical protein
LFKYRFKNFYTIYFLIYTKNNKNKMTHKELLNKLEEYHTNTDDNIVGVGYGYKTINGIITDTESIVFTVKQKIPKEKLTKEQLLPKQIEISNKIIPTDVIQDQFETFCDSNFYLWQNTGYTVPNRGIFRPVKGGISFTNYTSLGGFVGTLGFLAKDNDTNSIVGVSNNHVLVNDAFICSERSSNEVLTNIKGDISTQPNESGTMGLQYKIGSVKKYQPIYENEYNLIDAALSTISGSCVDSILSVNQEGLSFEGPFPFASTAEIDGILNNISPYYNPVLYSAGRTTGAKGEDVTKLLVYQFPAVASVAYNRQGTNVSVDYTDLIWFIATTGTTRPIGFVCPYPIWHGDSGSALIADLNGTKKIIGLVFAGSTYTGLACRIDHVKNLLNISEWNGESINYSDSNNILEFTTDGLSNVESVNYGGKVYYQVGCRVKV